MKLIILNLYNSGFFYQNEIQKNMKINVYNPELVQLISLFSVFIMLKLLFSIINEHICIRIENAWKMTSGPLR